jgi:hypothetical protein
MDTLRAFFSEHRRLAGLLIALALCMKALVPGGYMPAQHGKVLTISICADATGGKLTRQIVLPHSGKAGEHAKHEGTCPYAALGMAALAGADAVLLALAIAFVLALGFAPVRPPRPAHAFRLRPPLRGPPAHA